jgi:hypothetical protein
VANPGGATTGSAPTAGIYTLFTINVHEWALSATSTASVSRVIDIHERYQVPIDVYLTDPMVQLYVRQAPQLMQRLKTSPMVAVCYHLRPPAPYYRNFDILGLSSLSQQDLQRKLLEYEEHALDLATGRPTSAPGGFEYLKQLLGYAPKIVGMNRALGEPTLAGIYKDKGALFTVVHGRDVNFGEKENGLWVRPEHIEIRLFEATGTTGGTFLEGEIARYGSTPAIRVMNVKVHDNNFYTEHPAWYYCFFQNGTGPRLSPPFDLTAYQGRVTPLSAQRQQELWTIYEQAVAHVAAQRTRLRPINAFDLEQLAGGRP